MVSTPYLQGVPVARRQWGALVRSSSTPGDAFQRNAAYQAMACDWEVMAAVTNGSVYMRSLAETYLRKEPREDDDAYLKRVSRSVLSPFCVRLIENAAGLVLRRPIEIESEDSWWKDEFAKNVDGLGSSINEFARQRLTTAIAYGHSAILVDYPAVTARTLREERSMAPQPYWSGYSPQQIIGWRQASRVPSSPLTQLRLLEQQTVPEGDYGETIEEVVRILTPGGYRCVTYDGKEVDSGPFSLNEIPIVPIYAHRKGVLQSSPPLLDIATLNIAHYQRQADLLHALHVAAMPILVLEDWDEETGTTGVNYAISMAAGNKAYYVQSDASSFAAQQEMLTHLETQMSHLGVTRLLGQKMVAEAADAKRIDQQQANSVLAIISMELESALNEALRMSAAYTGRAPAKAKISRDFDFYRLLGQDVSVLSSMETLGQISPKAFVAMLHGGEWLPDSIDMQEELKETERLREERKKEQADLLEKQGAARLSSQNGAGKVPTPSPTAKRPNNATG